MDHRHAEQRALSVLHAANADEVGPDPFSPLGWSMVWMRGCNPGVAKGFAEFGVVDISEYDLTPLQVFANRGGYFYNPMSLSRLMGERMPGATAEAIDKAYFGDHPGVPPYEPHPDDVNEAQSAKLAETMGWVMTTPSYDRLHAASAMAKEAVASRPDFSTLSERRARCVRPPDDREGGGSVDSLHGCLPRSVAAAGCRPGNL